MSDFIVTGDGLLSKEIQFLLRKDGHVVHVLSRAGGVDVTKPATIELALEERGLRPGHVRAVFHTAAYTSVDGAEDNAEEAFRVNALGAENVARVAQRLASPAFVHFSTDAVFADPVREGHGGRIRFVTELDEPVMSPLGQYARSKLAGEKLVRLANPRAHILRVANLYAEFGSNWGSRLRDRIAPKAALVRLGQRDVHMDAAFAADIDRRVIPTWGRWVAEVAIALIRHPGGVYHVCPRGRAESWAMIASEMVAALAGGKDAILIPTNIIERRARLSQYGALATEMLPLRGLDVPHWRDLLSRYLNEERTTCTGS